MVMGVHVALLSEPGLEMRWAYLLPLRFAFGLVDNEPTSEFILTDLGEQDVSVDYFAVPRALHDIH